MFGTTRWLSWRPLHFLVAGFLGWWLSGPELHEIGQNEPVRLDVAQVEALREGWAMMTGQEPGEAEMRMLTQREIDDEILFREALAQSMHRSDAVVRQRLLLDMRFLGSQTPGTDEQLFEQALKLGLHRNDIVVRRRLVHLMELLLQQGADRSVPDRHELERMYEQRRGEFAIPARWRVRHMYFSSSRRGDRAGADARATLALLSQHAGGELPESAYGDPFLGSLVLPLLDERQLAAQFGSGFSSTIAACEPQRWCGPLRSDYGEHLMFIEEHEPAREPSIDEPEVRQRLANEVLRTRERDTLARAMSELRRHYGVQP